MSLSLDILNNTYKGKSCIILGAGPSTEEFNSDIVKEKNLTVIAVNGGYVKCQNADFFLTDDQGAYYAEYFRCLKDSKTKVLLYEDKYVMYNLLDKCSDMFGDRLFTYKHKKGYQVKCPYNNSDEQFFLPEARSSSITAIYVAIMLGFKNVYLLGIDCVYSGTRYFWGSDHPNLSLKNPFMQRRFKRMLKGQQTDSDLIEIYENFRLVSGKITDFVKVHNLSKLSALDVFPLVEWNDIV